MDPREHPEYDYTGQRVDEQMQIEAPLSSGTNPSDEIEMQTSESAAGPNSMDTPDTQHTLMNVSVPASASSDPTSTLSREMLFPTSSITQRTSMRRSRVEDDHDDERDRRHPSERLGSSSHSTNTVQQLSPLSSAHSIPSPASSRLPESTTSNAPRSPPSGNSRLNPFHFFRHILPRSPSNSNDTNQTPFIPFSSSSTNSLQQDGVTAGPSSGRTQTQTPAAAAVPPTTPNDRQPPPPRPNSRHQYLGGFTITIDVNGSMTTTPLPGTPVPTSPGANAAQGNAPPPSDPIPGVPLAPNDQASRENAIPVADQQAQTLHQPRTQPHEPQEPEATQALPNNTPDGPSAFADILAHIGLLAALTFRDPTLFERDVDDPERAKKLVDGLEDVPVGLIRRLERVGKTNTSSESEQNNEDRADSGLGDGGCAICWERLLLEAEESKQGGVIDEEKDKTPAQENETTPNPQGSPSLHTESDSTTFPSTSRLESSIEASEKGKQYQRIVTLPCAHVFHGDCLIPWFSKPKQTTCPICRFNIDPENLTYTSRAQRAAARAQTQQQGGGGNSTDATNGAHVDDENRADPGTGFDIPLMFAGGGEPPIIIPLGVGPVDSPQPGAPAPTDAPTPTGDAGNISANENQNRQPNGDVVTIGFDMYIGRGPPPFPLGGPNVFQIPAPGRPNNATPSPPSANVPSSTTGARANTAGNTYSGTTNQGNDPAENANPSTGAGNIRGPSGATIATSIPMGPGFGRALGDMLTRIISGHIPSGGNATGAGEHAEQGGPTQSQTQPQRPVPFGPERPPTMPPSGIPIPGGVGLGLGGGGALGGTGIQIMPMPPFVLPFGNRPAAMSAGGLGGSGGMSVRPGGAQPAMNTGADALPAFDVISGLFGVPPPPSQGRGQRVPATSNAQPSGTGAQFQAQPAQPQPRRAQDAQQAERLGFSWFPTGSPPPRPASAPTPRQQVPRKKWTLPPPPGLTLRQRVEKWEKEAGLRCCDVSCGVGPSDEDPWIHVSEHGLKQLNIRASPSPEALEKIITVDSGVGFDRFQEESENVSGDMDTKKELERKLVCSHTFHSSCLVSSERVSLALRDANVTFVGPEGKKEVEVSCPVCRGTGRVSKEEWDAGVEALS